MKRLFVLGDSISIDYGPELERLTKGIFHYDRKGKNAAPGDLDRGGQANGGDSSNCLAYLRESFPAADLVLLNCGLHDIKIYGGQRQVADSAYRRNLNAIFKLASTHAVTPVWLRTTPVDDETHRLCCPLFQRFNRDVIACNAIADEVTAAWGVVAIDLYGFTLSLGPDCYRDHVHFKPEFAAAQARFIASKLISF
ncbi:MAG: SGNH/GDSL hydrolase family protein [Victivallaceae bacterium]